MLKETLKNFKNKMIAKIDSSSGSSERIKALISPIEDRLRSLIEEKESEIAQKLESVDAKVVSGQDLQTRVQNLEEEVNNLRRSQASAVKTLYGFHSNVL